MKKFLTVIAIWGLFSTISAMAEVQKIAVVDVNKIVSSSSAVKSMKKVQQAKQKELEAFIQTAKADVKKQKTVKEQKESVLRYENQLTQKRAENIKEYAESIKEADKIITEQISKKASEMGYTLVLPKSAVLYGGDDITDTIIKYIK